MDLKAHNIRDSNENTLPMLQSVLHYSQILENITQRQQFPRGQNEKEGAEFLHFYFLTSVTFKMALAIA